MEIIYKIKNKFIRAIFLLIVSPYVIFNYVIYKFNKKIRLIICAICLILITVLINNLVNQIASDKNRVIDCSQSFATSIKRPRTDFIVIHHIAAKKGNVNDIAQIHIKEHKWSTIGYHYFVRKDGTIIQIKPDDEVAPHALHFNDNCVAICLEGNFSEEFLQDEQKEALIYIVKEMQKKYQISKQNVVRHCDLEGNNTECCGVKFNLEEIKKCLD